MSLTTFYEFDEGEPAECSPLHARKARAIRRDIYALRTD